MTVRSHWISVVAFFVCGVLTGGVVLEKTRIDRQLDLWAESDAGCASLSSPEVQSWPMLTFAHSAMQSLELAAAGDLDRLRESDEMYVATTLARLKWMPELHTHGYEMLVRRFADWKAGRPWVWHDGNVEQAPDVVAQVDTER